MASTINADNGVSSGSAGLKSSADSSGQLHLQTNGTVALQIDTSQNVGIGGIISGSAKLAVNGPIQAYNASSGEGGQIDLMNPDFITSGLSVDVSTANVGRIFQTANNSTLSLGQLGGTGGVVTFSTAATERMRIDANGNVGIGITPNAVTKFQAKIATNQVFSLYSGTFAANAVGITAVNDAYNAYVPLDLLASTIQFGTGGTERMRIDANGNVGIGVTPISFSTYKYLNVRGGAAGTGGIFYTDTSDGSVAGQFYSSTGQVVLGSPTATPLVFQTNNAERLRIDTSGNVSSASDQYRTRYYQTGSFIPTSTKWWRLCTMPATNAGQHVEFIFSIQNVHLLMRVKFSKTTAGGFTGGGVMEVELLGSYVYWNYYPFDWRLTDGGTNLPSYLDIRFPSNAGETVTYKIQVLHSWALDGSLHETFPITDQGTGTTGGYYSNMGNLLGWTKQWFRLTGSKYVYYDNNMTITSGATPPTA